MRRRIPAFFAIALAAGCYPPALRVQDPPPGETGVRVVLRGQDCEGDLALSDGRGAHSLDESFDTTNSHLGTQRALLIVLGIVGVR